MFSRQETLILGSLVVAAADLMTKALACVASPGGPIVPLQNNEFSLGIPGPGHVAMLVLAVALLGAATRYVSRLVVQCTLHPWLGACLIGGAAANALDRAVFGAVHDFFAVGDVVLNLGDVAVAVGLVATIAASLRSTFVRDLQHPR